MIPAQSGWHWPEWLSEFAGTALLLLGGLSGLFLCFGPGTGLDRVIASTSARLALTGVLLGVSGLLVTFSPLGRRSGAHLNPAVSLAFWSRGHMHAADLAGYVAAQVTGAVAGTALAAVLWRSDATALRYGATAPAPGIPALTAAVLEAAMTFVLVTAILLAVSSPRTVPFAPLAAWGSVAVLVWFGGLRTGASLNPARSLAPAILVPDFGDLWVYLVGPLAGSLFAVGFHTTVLRLETRTAKLLHDPRYRSTMATSLAARQE
jgi:aquaporin Z